MFEDYKYLFENTYASRWDFIHNKNKVNLSYYEDEKIFFVGDDDETFNDEFSSFLDALEFFTRKSSAAQ